MTSTPRNATDLLARRVAEGAGPRGLTDLNTNRWLLTPTQKLKRSALAERVRHVVERFYDGTARDHPTDGS